VAQADVILGALTDREMTAEQLAALLNMNVETIRRRLNDLYRRGKVFRSSSKPYQYNRQPATGNRLREEPATGNRQEASASAMRPEGAPPSTAFAFPRQPRLGAPDGAWRDYYVSLAREFGYTEERLADRVCVYLEANGEQGAAVRRSVAAWSTADKHAVWDWTEDETDDRNPASMSDHNRPIGERLAILFEAGLDWHHAKLGRGQRSQPPLDRRLTTEECA